MKKFSIGVSLGLTLDDYKNIFDTYGDRIDELYFSLPLGREFQSRHLIHTQFLKEENIKKLLSILKLAKEKNISLELVVNGKLSLKEEDIELCYNWCKKHNVQIDSITTFNHLVEKAKSLFGNIKFKCSYNQNLRTYEDLEKVNPLFDEVILGNNFIRDVKAFKTLKSKGFKVRILLNNGCHHNCAWCSYDKPNTCEKTFEHNIQNNSFEYLFAIQSVFPNELTDFYEKLDCVDSYKLSTRTKSRVRFTNILKVYLDNEFKCFLKDLMSSCSLQSLHKYLIEQFETIDFEEVLRIKNEIIKKEMSTE